MLGGWITRSAATLIVVAIVAGCTEASREGQFVQNQNVWVITYDVKAGDDFDQFETVLIEAINPPVARAPLAFHLHHDGPSGDTEVEFHVEAGCDDAGAILKPAKDHVSSRMPQIEWVYRSCARWQEWPAQ